jgi:hypothetical protein
MAPGFSLPMPWSTTDHQKLSVIGVVTGGFSSAAHHSWKAFAPAGAAIPFCRKNR